MVFAHYVQWGIRFQYFLKVQNILDDLQTHTLGPTMIVGIGSSGVSLCDLVASLVYRAKSCSVVRHHTRLVAFGVDSRPIYMVGKDF